MIKTLAIETSCDDTSVGIVSFDGKKFDVVKLTSFSQVDQHKKYGGVVPEVASRLHGEKIIDVLEDLGKDLIREVDLISYTSYPGLPWSLLVGISTANFLSSHLEIPAVEINHIHGHLFSIFLERNIDEIKFPLIVLSVSGWHNDLYLVDKKPFEWEFEKIWSGDLSFYIKKLGQTIDDAAWESFDKVARMLGGPYPGWPRIWKKALEQPQKRPKPFKRVFLDRDNFDFSFSGMKSQVWRLTKDKENLSSEEIRGIAREFQETVTDILTWKLERAFLKYRANGIAVVGWVSANTRLQQKVEDLSQKYSIPFYFPLKTIYSTDNAAMIGVVGIMQSFKSLNW